MESSARLDYVLFHLTPTRTRCDLVIFAGKLSEKLAYGLLEPFIAHLKSARDQISKGGYSVTLRPQSPANSHWFTKGTLQRFVRFVSSPEVLERFVTIEREISQLENSIKSYEASNADGDAEGNGVGGNARSSAIKSYGEFNGSSDVEPEENSKARLHRVVETRKAVLRKEQAMVFARALAAGYEMDNLHDLLLFSDTFGASRLREACINFTDLCKKKNEDRHWVDEIAAMQAMMPPELSYMGTSGIVLAGEDNDPTQGTEVSMSDSMISHGSSDATQDNDAKAQSQIPWPNQFHPYMRNFQGPMYQQMHPYQGYGFPGMQMAPPYYPPNMPWPTNVNGSADHESYDRRDRKKSSKKKGKASKARGSENENQDEDTEPSGSSTGTETDSSSDRSHRKRQGKKSSRKVVIRNINYISSKRDGDSASDSETDSSGEGDVNGDSLKQQLEEAVGSFEKHQKSSSRHHRKRNGSKHRSSADKEDEEISEKTKSEKKGNEGWDAFQQLLLKEESESNVPVSHLVPVEEEYFVTSRSEEQNSSAFKLEVEERSKQKPLATDAFLITEKGSGTYSSGGKISDESFEHNGSYHPVMKRGGTPEEFLFSHRGEEPDSYARAPLSDDVTGSSMMRSHASDDWFISKQSDDALNLGKDSQPRFIDGDYVTPSVEQTEKRNKEAVVDDSLMIQGRLVDDRSASQLRTDISLVSDFIEASFMEKGATDVVEQEKSEPVSFYEPDELYMALDRDTSVEQTVPSWTPEMDFENNALVNNGNKVPDQSPPSDSASNEKGPRNKKVVASATKASSRDARSRVSAGPLRRGKPETTPGPRRSTFGSKTTISRSQSEKEEERIKRIEELRLERQKRIAERSGTGDGSPVKPQMGRKPVTTSLSGDRSKNQSSAEEAKKPKPTLRSSTIERLAVAKTTPKSPPAPPKKEASKVKGANMNSVAQKTKDVDTPAKKLNTDKISPLEKEGENENLNGNSSFISHVKEAHDANKDYTEVPSSGQSLDASGEVDDSKDIKELHITSSIINKDVNVVVQMDTSDEIVGNPLEEHSTISDSVKDNRDGVSGNSLSNLEESSSELNSCPVPEFPIKMLSSDLIVEKTITNGNVTVSPGISVIEESTPQLIDEVILEPTQSRKKWEGSENSTKSIKGFRKLLMFGRKK